MHELWVVTIVVLDAFYLGLLTFSGTCLWRLVREQRLSGASGGKNGAGAGGGRAGGGRVDGIGSGEGSSRRGGRYSGYSSLVGGISSSTTNHLSVAGRRIWQKSFHACVVAGALIRIIFWSIQPWIWSDKIIIRVATNFLLNSLPSYAFFVTYLILIFFWAEIFHSHRSPAGGLSISRFRNAFLGVVGFMCVSVLGLYIADYIATAGQHSTYSNYQMSVPELSLLVFDASMYTLAAIAFTFYGLALTCLVRRAGRPSNKGTRLLFKIGFIASAVTLFFLVRAFWTMFAVFHPSSDVEWWFLGGYYLLTEILPLVLIIYILRRASGGGGGSSGGGGVGSGGSMGQRRKTAGYNANAYSYRRTTSKRETTPLHVEYVNKTTQQF